jgi:hypothetical protein
MHLIPQIIWRCDSEVLYVMITARITFPTFSICSNIELMLHIYFPVERVKLGLWLCGDAADDSNHFIPNDVKLMKVQ